MERCWVFDGCLATYHDLARVASATVSSLRAPFLARLFSVHSRYEVSRSSSMLFRFCSDVIEALRVYRRLVRGNNILPSLRSHIYFILRPTGQGRTIKPLLRSMSLAGSASADGAIAKPRFGVASAGVVRIRTVEDALKVRFPEEGLLAELCLHGTQYSFETFSCEGQHASTEKRYWEQEPVNA